MHTANGSSRLLIDFNLFMTFSVVLKYVLLLKSLFNRVTAINSPTNCRYLYVINYHISTDWHCMDFVLHFVAYTAWCCVCVLQLIEFSVE